MASDNSGSYLTPEYFKKADEDAERAIQEHGEIDPDNPYWAPLVRKYEHWNELFPYR